MPAPVRIELTTFPAPTVRRGRVLLGQAMAVTANVLDAAGAPVAVTGLSFAVRRPDGLVIEGSAFETLSTGVYRMTVQPDLLGEWRVQALCTGPYPAASRTEWDCWDGEVLTPAPAAPILVTDDLGALVTETGGTLTVKRIGKLPAAAAPDVGGLVIPGATLAGQSRHITGQALLDAAATQGAAQAAAGVAAEAAARAAALAAEAAARGAATLEGGAFVGAGAGAVDRRTQARLREEGYSPEDYKGVTTDDGAAIRAAIAATALAGGGTVAFAAREYVMSTAGDANYCLSLSGVSGVRLKGRGRRRTVIKVGTGLARGPISITGCSEIEIEGITFDGNNTTLAHDGLHGVRLDAVSGLSMRRFTVRNTRGYGVAFQGIGAFKDIVLDDGRIERTMIDGIDFKNRANGNESVRISNMVIEHHGLANDGSAGVDLRAPAAVINVYVYARDPALSVLGFRAREDSVETGRGGQYTVLMNCHVIGAQAGGGTGCIGFAIYAPYTNAIGCQVNNFQGTAYHIASQAKFSGLASCKAHMVERGIWFQGGDRQSAVACAVDGAVSEAFRIDGASNASLIRCDGFNSDKGVRMLNGATNLRLAFFAAAGNADDYELTPGQYRAVECEGLATAANVSATGLAADATGTRSFSVPHGLDRTPAVNQVQLTVFQETGASDYRWNPPRIDGVTATHVNGRVVVTVASATTGATFGVAISVRQ